MAATIHRRAISANGPVLVLALLLLGVLLAGVAYQVALALEVVKIGRLPGQGAPGQDLVLVGALAAMLAAALLCGALAFTDTRVLFAVGLAPAAAAFVTARFFTFDPYYAPTLRRFSDGGFVSDWWLMMLCLTGLATGFLCYRAPSYGYALSSCVIVTAAFTAILQGAGH